MSDDIFVEMRRAQAEFFERAKGAPKVTITGVVDAGGPAGVAGQDGAWFLVLELEVWREPDGDICHEELRCEQPLDRAELDRVMETVQPHAVVRLEVQLAEHECGELRASITRVLETEAADAELQGLAAELQKPVTVEHEALGTFTLDRRIDAWRGKARWRGDEVDLDLNVDEDGEGVDRPAAVAAELLADQASWQVKIDAALSAELLALKNDSWLEDGESALTEEQFLQRIQAEALHVYPDGDFELYYDDGDLFWGHCITVSGSLEGGVAEAKIQG